MTDQKPSEGARKKADNIFDIYLTGESSAQTVVNIALAIDEARREERERAAKIAENYTTRADVEWRGGTDYINASIGNLVGENIAAAIRALSAEPVDKDAAKEGA